MKLPDSLNEGLRELKWSFYGALKSGHRSSQGTPCEFFWSLKWSLKIIWWVRWELPRSSPCYVGCFMRLLSQIQSMFTFRHFKNVHFIYKIVCLLAMYCFRWLDNFFTKKNLFINIYFNIVKKTVFLTLNRIKMFFKVKRSRIFFKNFFGNF